MKTLKSAAAVVLCLALTLAMTACKVTPISSASSSSQSTVSSQSASGSSSATTCDMQSTKYTLNYENPDFSAGLTDEGLWEGITATDYVTFSGDYTNLTSTVADTDVDDYIQNTLLPGYATSVKVTDRAVADGDTVNIDYVGTVDGVEFTGGNTQGAGTDVTIGVTSYIDGFLDQLVGHKPGETFDITVTFPDGYNDSTDASGKAMVLANKEAVFRTTVNYISESVNPELNQEFIDTNFSGTYADVDELRAAVKKTLISNDLQDQLFALATVSEVPEPLLTWCVNASLYQQYSQWNSSYGVDLATVLGAYGYSKVDDYIDENLSDMTSSGKTFLILQAVAEQHNITVSEDEVKQYLGISDDSATSLESLIQSHGKGYVYAYALYNKVADSLGNL